MKVSVRNRFLSIFSLASIATTVLVNPAAAEPITYRGEKGTYTVDIGAGTYRGCLYNGGCISLGRKYLLKPANAESTDISWKNGEYKYEISGGGVNVSQNGRLIFQDRISIDSSEVSQLDRPRSPKSRKTNKINKCSTFSECTRPIDNDPQNPYPYLSRSEFYQYKQEYEKALTDLNMAVELAPKNSDVYLSRAEFLSSNFRGNIQAVLDDYNQAIEINPRNSSAYLGRFKFKSRHGQSDDSGILDDLNQAIETNPHNSEGYLYRAYMETSKGNDRQALNDCHLARKHASTSNDKDLAEQCIRRINDR